MLAGVTAEHPLLMFAALQVKRAQAQHAAAEASARRSPTLLVGPRRERPASGDHFDDSIGLTISVPVGGRAHVRAAASASAREVAAARTHALQARRHLDLETHEATHGLTVVEQSLGAARERSSLTTRHHAMGMTAYEQGEIDLMNLLKLQKAALSSIRRVDLLETDGKRLAALYNQAVGVTP